MQEGGADVLKTIPPKVAAVHDLSCFGRCSLTVILPALSAMGVQVCPLPTAIFSTHLGGFTNIVCHDFADQLAAVSRHWQQEQLTFDCLYSGFLASEAQFDAAETFLKQFCTPQTLVFVDPVMGDNGRLYSAYTDSLCGRMKKLVQQADVITPNYTEACFLLGEAYDPGCVSGEMLRAWCRRLSALGPGKVVITGIPAGDELLNLGYDHANGAFVEVRRPLVPARYPGTGDLFASVLLGALLQAAPFAAALEQAADFVGAAVGATYAAQTPVREGVLFEPLLGRLAK